MFATGTDNVWRVNILKRFFDLNRFPAFKDLDEKYFNLLNPLFEPYSCAAGVTVLQQGHVAEYLYLVIKGTVEVSYKPYDGVSITVTHIGNGGLFGWSAVVGSDKYTSSSIAIEELEAVRIRGSELRKLCAEHPEAGKEILERLASSVSSRWKDAHEQVKSILTQGMRDDKNM